MKPLQALSDYLYLNGIPAPTSLEKNLKDTLLQGTYLLREYGTTVSLIFLGSGASLKVPIEYLRIGRSMNTLGGLDGVSENSKEPIDQFITSLLRLVQDIDTKSSGISGRILGMASLGTVEFRKVVMELTEKDLGPWIYEDQNTRLEL